MPDEHGWLEITLPALSVAAGERSFGWIDFTLPVPEVAMGSGLTDYAMLLSIPSLEVALHGLSGNSSQINISLGWPQLANPIDLNLQGGGHLDITWPVPTFSANTLVSTLLKIAFDLPLPSAALNPSQEILGWIDIELPSLTESVHLLSENKGQIAGAIPFFNTSFRGKTGAVGAIDIELPFMFYDSTLLSEGLIDLAIALPCLITTVTGDIESATLSYRTIVMNTMNFGVTEYGALELKGMTDAFGKVIAINANDLVRIGAGLDDTAQIDATLQTGTLDFSEKFFTKPRDIWVTLRSGKKISLTIKDNEVPDNESTYDSEPFVDNLHKTRIKVGRGFFSEFFDMTFQNIDGELVDIKDIHVFSETVPGRKR